MYKIFSFCTLWFQKGAHYLYLHLLQPNISKSEDDQRRERILTIILLGIIVLSIIFQGITILNTIRLQDAYAGTSPYIHGTLLLLYILSFIAVRRGYYKSIGYLLITILFSTTAFGSFVWGASMPMGLLSFALIITIGSIVIHSTFGVILSVLSSIVLLISGTYEHARNSVPAWKTEVLTQSDIIEYSIMLSVITLLSWLSTKEIEKSLRRARTSEQALKNERDNLEILVLKRTEELRALEKNRVHELYHFAEFGKISAGLFHDLINPLTAVALSVSRLKDKGEEQHTIDTAIKATKRMEQFMNTVRKQIKTNELETNFSVNTEIENVIDLLSFKAREKSVSLLFSAEENIELFGNALKFNQIITNLIANGIDAYDTVSTNNKQLHILLKKESSFLILSVRDEGEGIPEENTTKIFTPFFTTKTNGIGLGLSITHDIVCTIFKGTLVYTRINNQTIFTVTIPLLNHGSRITRTDIITH